MEPDDSMLELSRRPKNRKKGSQANDVEKDYTLKQIQNQEENVDE